MLCSIAENKLSYDLLQSKLEHDPNINQALANYAMFGGMEPFKKGIANMLEKYVFHCAANTVNTQHLCVGAGTTALLEGIFFALCDQGDSVIIPSPMYPAFVTDARVRAGVKVIPASLTDTAAAAEGKVAFKINVEELERAYQKGKDEGSPVKAVVLCSPNNPTGTVFSSDELNEVIAFCRKHNIHLISDEIYALSIFGEKPFVSVYELLDGKLGNDIHIVSGFSKDFCLNGYRAGYIYTQNAQLLRYLYKEYVFFQCSNPVQSVLANILNDDAFLGNFIQENQKRLKSHYALTLQLLKEQNIPYIDSDSGMYLLLDVRQLLKEQTFDAELPVWCELFKQSKVLVNSGKSTLGDVPGLFRFIFCHKEPQLRIAIQRLGKAYNNILATTSKSV
ncbi:hypothetical protein SAMD00019534_115250 [Acytostelium subglobosum LB1]|uniref:hypothetical protein n=1 Tax=Acytostelium subglobosum LB1 TaxID=1410327 RepID=UPI00064482BB|nr:hypothetical protein SAMD00019534_115250 [Acytostelium subglobosum LB1]GAM28349.1 hypothetical protein SAMD00019534_115250 [Acytostelium subglobosum LB1]|eukprot:XP_012748666.1 hypothetical protein SAMD00019534_115250 [Acytostelium subglobosum LB1]